LKDLDCDRHFSFLFSFSSLSLSEDLPPPSPILKLRMDSLTPEAAIDLVYEVFSPQSEDGFSTAITQTQLDAIDKYRAHLPPPEVTHP